MAFPIIPLRNAVATSDIAPLAGSMQVAELAVNTASGKLFMKANSGVVEIGGGAVQTSQLTTLAEANKVPQLTGAGLISTNQILNLTTAQFFPALTTAAIAGLVPQLGVDGKISSSQLPAASVGALTYKGAWTVNTSPVITATTVDGEAPAKGDYYVAANSGTVGGLGNNITQILAGDIIAWNGAATNPKWDLIHGARNEVVTVNSVAPVNGNVTLTASNVGALSADQITQLAEAGKVPQLNASGQIATVQLQVATTAQLGVLSIDSAASNGLFISAGGAAKVIPGTSTVVGGVKSSASIEIAVDGTATVASAGTY
jgi:hypothetical protein